MDMVKRVAMSLVSICALSFTQQASAGVSISPFASVSSTKKIKPNKANKQNEDVNEVQHTTYGIMGSISFFSLMRFQLSVGQSETTNTQKSQTAVDEYEEIDYKQDLSVGTDGSNNDVKTTDTQRKGRVGLAIDPSFSIFIVRAKAGVQATDRTVKVEEEGKAPVEKKTPIKYKPYAGMGAGIRFSPRMYFMAEYSFFLYKFPEKSPFEREVTVGFAVNI